ncbi:MAG: DNA recombination protein RmuC [Sphaerochaetaceae bacterium]
MGIIVVVLVLAIVFLVILLFRKRSEDPYLKASLDQLTRDNSVNRTEMLNMLEQFRTSVNQSVGILDKQVASSLDKIRSDNDAKLELIRQSVDSRLSTSLSQSFQVVSQQLNAVHKGLGEMQELANGVNDLKRILGNIKSRGIMGEIQAKNILDDILTRDQYDTNVICKKGSQQRVEFAVKLPGSEDGAVYLPIDCKFPKEDYERLLDAQDRADKEAVRVSMEAIRRRLLEEAKDINEKYIDPPNTTEFALLFLPAEGLYAEALRIPGLADSLQKQFKVILSGPTTLAAILNSLQMGFETLAIEKRSSEVWTILSMVKTEFSKFSDALMHTQQKLEQASSSLADVNKRTAIMSKKLKDVQSLDVEKEVEVLSENMQ